MTIALIDGDIILYRVGWTTENNEEWIAKARTDDLLDSILLDVEASEFQVFLTDNKENNFRFKIWKGYHANRKAPRPKHYEFIKEYLVREWGARFAHGMEADDALGIAQGEGTVICSIDKDLKQIPGEHYNFVTKEWDFVNDWSGKQWFYKQILIGDTADNVKGCTGVGPVKASRAIDPIPQEEGEQGLYSKVLAVYRKYETKKTDQEILDHISLVGKLLKIKTTEDEPEWEPPQLSPKSLVTVEDKLSSTQPKPVETIQSTEPTTQALETSGLSLLGTSKANSSSEEIVPSISQRP